MTTRMAAFLVTGGCGFIGSHLVEHLLARGDNVVCLDNLDPYYDPDLKLRNLQAVRDNAGFSFVEGDIRDADFLNQLFRRKRFDVVVHLAAKVGVNPSLAQPNEYSEVNVGGTQNILEAMRHHLVRKLIFASSSSVYGGTSTIPFVETDPADRPLSPYAATKRSGELLCSLYHHLWNIDVSCLRFFTVYGPRQRPEMAIHAFTRRMSEGGEIQVYGDGSSARDYTYIDDILDGVLKAIEKVRGFEIFNLGESHKTSLRELIALLEASLGKKAAVAWLPPREGDMKVTFADVQKAEKLLGYKPRVSVEEGIRMFLRWYREVDRRKTGSEHATVRRTITS